MIRGIHVCRPLVSGLADRRGSVVCFTWRLQGWRRGSENFCAQHRGVTVWPQWPYDESARNAKPVGDPNFRWPPPRPARPGQKQAKLPVPAPGGAKPLELEDPRVLERARLKLHRRIWRAMSDCDWGEWERCLWEMRDRQIPYDEVTYVLLIHGHLLSHRHSSENAYTALEEMRQAEVHPALVRLQEKMLSSAFELKELQVQPEGKLWQHIARLSWHCTSRFQKKRRQRLQNELENLHPDEALALSGTDVQRWIRGHDTLSLPPPGTGVERFQLPERQKLQLLEEAIPSGIDGDSRRRRGRRRKLLPPWRDRPSERYS